MANTTNWASRDFHRAEHYLRDHEEDIQAGAVVDCGNGVYALIPKGLPALKISFQGLFMIAPLPLLVACVIFLPLSGFSGEWEVNATTLGISALCLLMMLGLIRVILIMLNNRDMFPRKHFVTLGPEGLAMHFSRFHFPALDPRARIPWKAVHSVEKKSCFFFPALLLGRLRVPALQVQSAEGPAITIPLHSPPPEREPDFERMEALIRQHRTN
ncbi:MAG: hypothetical protein GWM98_06040 [Nitrospinaceae bacterium]|nr:hypothetical protein [Nitrospinaceae bacterium]NIR54119.1 hypothetical protein [Nitrospinaceae bacterium]NIS84539.1 hypothetical protein [Nitrospinaceae bacterium]NIT81331.1 hypothetical protein [Nitrospinaceae bacterium]NIU43620.1 hypothetical protein [Nitrospinaceae bacterium]